MSRAQEAFEQAARKLILAPERLLKLCMEQYRARERERDGRIKAEDLAEERKRVNDAMVLRIQEERRKYKDADKELGKYKHKYEEKVRKLEILKFEVSRILGQLNRAAETISDLKDQISRQIKRADEAEMERDAIKKDCTAALEDAERGWKEVSRLQEQVGLHGKARFDSTTEKTLNLFHGIDIEDDPIGEDVLPDGSRNYSADEVIRRIGAMIERKRGGKKKVQKKTVGKREKDLGKIRLHRESCDYSEEELAGIFRDEAGYRVYGSNVRNKIGLVRPTPYVSHEHTPKVVVTDEDGKKKYVKTMPSKNGFFRNSKADYSLVAGVFYYKFNLGLPYNRIENELKALGADIRRQDMKYWQSRFGKTAFHPIHRWLSRELWAKSSVVHIDETTWRVVDWKSMNRGQRREYKRKNGSKGFIWVMTTGEFSKGHQVVLYTFDPSRSAEVLNENVKSEVVESLVYIVCDAYAAYDSFVKQFPGKFRKASCWMHARRRFSEAVCVLKPWLNKNALPEELEDIPEVKGLLMANRVFEEDTPLKGLTASERYKKRKIKVKPVVDEYFEYLRSIDMKDEKYSEKFKEAVQYSLNNEETLRTFLLNGNIPIDNGRAERAVKPISVTRKSSLFSYSREGGEIAAMIHSIIQTAKANGADPYTYLKYIITMMPDRPKGLEDNDYSYLSDEFLDGMMPWSKKYREYEKWHHDNHIDEMMPSSGEMPEGIKGRRIA